MCSTHDFALRALLTDFLRQPEACAGISERWEKDERLEAMMLWHSVVTPNQCSFASMASTEQTIAFLGGAPQCARRDQRRDPIPAVPSFLDLTSSLARLVRGASIPGSPARDVSKTRSESPVGRMGPGPADSSSSGRGFALGKRRGTEKHPRGGGGVFRGVFFCDVFSGGVRDEHDRCLAIVRVRFPWI